MGFKIGIGNIDIRNVRPFDWAAYWAARYIDDVLYHQGNIVDESYLKTEIGYAVSHNIYDKIAWWVDKKFGIHNAGVPVPLVSFSYDDGKVSDYTTWQHFAAKGLGRGTSFICTKFIGTAGFLTWAQIAEMYADGWDFQCHTWSHARSNDYGGDVAAVLGLTGCTEAQIREELENSNADFIAHGLPEPKHLAYPNYLTNPVVSKIVGEYRKTARTGSTVYIPGNDLNSMNWMYYGSIGSLSTAGSSNLRKVSLDAAILSDYPIHLADHSPNLAELDDFLDYVYAQGLTPLTVSQYWNTIDSIRYKEFNIAKNNYKTINFYDDSTKIEADGQIVFNDTFVNIGADVVAYYKAKGYAVAFWDDDSSEAIDCIYSDTPYFNGVSCVFNQSNDRITITGHGLRWSSAQSIVYFSGDTEPGNVIFGTDYYASIVNANELKISAAPAGATIDITSDGVNVKIHSHSAREILGATLKTAEDHVNRTAALTISHQLFGCTLNDMGFLLMRRKEGISSLLIFTNLLLSGTFPSELLSFIPADLAITYHKITGGLNNIINSSWARKLNKLSLHSGLINEAIPANIGNLIKIIAFELFANQITGSIPRSIGQCVKTTFVYLYANLMTGIIPVELSTLILCQRFRFQSNLFSSYEAGAISVGMTALIEIDLSVNAIADAADINQILADCILHEAANGTNVTLLLTGGTNAAPTGQGITDKNTLNAAGWTVTTN